MGCRTINLRIPSEMAQVLVRLQSNRQWAGEKKEHQSWSTLLQASHNRWCLWWQMIKYTTILGSDLITKRRKGTKMAKRRLTTLTWKCSTRSCWMTMLSRTFNSLTSMTQNFAFQMIKRKSWRPRSLSSTCWSITNHRRSFQSIQTSAIASRRHTRIRWLENESRYHFISGLKSLLWASWWDRSVNPL